MNPITILTGPAAAGKNTIAQVYATQFCERCAVIDVDLVRGMLRQPHFAPWDGTQGLEQHRLGVKHACMLAKSFLTEGYEVVLLDVVWPDLGQLYRQEFAGHYLRIVRLMPSWDESLRPLHSRPPSITDAHTPRHNSTHPSFQQYHSTLATTTL